MQSSKASYRKFSICMIVFAFCGSSLFSQHLDSLAAFSQRLDSAGVPSARDSIFQKAAQGGSHLDSLKSVIEQARKKSVSIFELDMQATQQEEIVEKLKIQVEEASAFIKTGIDTSGLNDELDNIGRWYAMAGDGIFFNRGTSQTFRNLETSYKIMSELLDRINLRKKAVEGYHDKLIVMRNRIDSLASDPRLYFIPPDSIGIVKFTQKIKRITTQITPAFEAFKKALGDVEVVESNLNQMAFQLRSSLEEIDKHQAETSREMLGQEFHSLWDTVGKRRPFSEIVSISRRKSRLSFVFYISNNTLRVFLTILAIAAAFYFLWNLQQNLKRQGLIDQKFLGQLVTRYPFLSSVFIVLNLMQFAFPSPPFLFNMLLWTLMTVIVSIIFYKFISTFWFKAWLFFFFLFLVAGVDNLILQASRPERWIMLGFAVPGAVSAGFLLMNKRKAELHEKSILYFIGFMAVMESLSIFFNFFGRYTVAKIFFTTGYFSVIIGTLFLWTIRLINEGLSIAARVYDRPDRKLFYVNFNKVGSRLPSVFYVALLLGWLILLGRNFYSYKLITAPIHQFVVESRSIGQFTFTLQSLLVFFSVLILSVLASKLVSFFATDKPAGFAYDRQKTKSGIGSWMLLVRISIITLGVLFAFAAAGIPMDRITIILGALGVGIGFGLQALVNNLVSGLIISFEKPMGVGDIVEIGGKAGVVKSIGFRSSMITTWDGAELVIPNGDLLNQHLINWTLNNSNRRVTIKIGVAYGTDLKQARDLIVALCEKDDRILKNPAPAVMVTDFAESSVNLELTLWVLNISQWITVKSDIMAGIHQLFRTNGIAQPFPQREIYIHREEEE